MDQVKKYLVEQQVEISDETGEAKAVLKDISTISGEASIAVIRGEPRMGYELNFKAVMHGVAGTYLEDLEFTVEVEEFCDDGSDPEGADIAMVKMLDTNQGSVAKEIIGYDSQLDWN